MRTPQRVVIQGAVSAISQSNVIAACLFIAFIVFITMRGKLPAYLAALFGTNSGGTAPQADAAPSASEAASDPIGAAAGAIRRGLGVSNGIGGNLRSLLGM